jgi:CBS domain-containing protein
VTTTGTVAEAMTAGVLTCPRETSLRDVARMMSRHRVHAIVVLGEDSDLRPWGVVSDLDLVGAMGADATAGSIAASPIVTVTPELPVERAATLMAEHATTHLLVLSGAGAPVGILSTLDVATVLAG